MMRSGDCKVMPGGWSCTEVPAEYHVALYVITRGKASGNGALPKGTDCFHFSVVNTGAGLEHHLQHVDPHSGRISQVR
jgi:hypothetical protein